MQTQKLFFLLIISIFYCLFFYKTFYENPKAVVLNIYDKSEITDNSTNAKEQEQDQEQEEKNTSRLIDMLYT